MESEEHKLANKTVTEGEVHRTQTAAEKWGGRKKDGEGINQRALTHSPRTQQCGDCLGVGRR